MAAWKARINDAKGISVSPACTYIVNQKISMLVRIFEGRDPAYATLPWNTNPEQMKAHILQQEDFWGDDIPDLEMALPRLLDSCASAAIFAVEACLSDKNSLQYQRPDEALEEIKTQRHMTGAILMGLPLELYSVMSELPTQS